MRPVVARCRHCYRWIEKRRLVGRWRHVTTPTWIHKARPL